MDDIVKVGQIWEYIDVPELKAKVISINSDTSHTVKVIEGLTTSGWKVGDTNLLDRGNILPNRWRLYCTRHVKKDTKC